MGTKFDEWMNVIHHCLNRMEKCSETDDLSEILLELKKIKVILNKIEKSIEEQIETWYETKVGV